MSVRFLSDLEVAFPLWGVFGQAFGLLGSRDKAKGTLLCRQPSTDHTGRKPHFSSDTFNTFEMREYCRSCCWISAGKRR